MQKLKEILKDIFWRDRHEVQQIEDYDNEEHEFNKHEFYSDLD